MWTKYAKRIYCHLYHIPNSNVKKPNEKILQWEKCQCTTNIISKTVMMSKNHEISKHVRWMLTTQSTATSVKYTGTEASCILDLKTWAPLLCHIYKIEFAFAIISADWSCRLLPESFPRYGAFDLRKSVLCPNNMSSCTLSLGKLDSFFFPDMLLKTLWPYDRHITTWVLHSIWIGSGNLNRLGLE